MEDMHVVFFPKQCWSLTWILPCNLLQGVSVAGSCTTWEGPLGKFELEFLKCPMVATSKLSELNLRPVFTQPGFEELVDSPFIRLPGGVVPSVCPLLSSAGQSHMLWFMENLSSWLGLILQHGKGTGEGRRSLVLQFFVFPTFRHKFCAGSSYASCPNVRWCCRNVSESRGEGLCCQTVQRDGCFLFP